jgi:uncharacterized protein YlxP (DUF503 family)
MVVGVLRADLAILSARSLKDKRRVVNRVKDRVSNKHRVSVAEVDALDLRQRAIIGVAMVANERRFVERCLYQIVDELRREPDASLVDFEVEFV